MVQYNWSGKYGPGAMREHRLMKRTEAEERATRVLPSRTRKHRLAQAQADREEREFNVISSAIGVETQRSRHSRWITTKHREEMERNQK